MNLEDPNDCQASSQNKDTKPITISSEPNDFWWDDSSLKPNDLLQKSENWTLGADAATATILKSISEKLLLKTQEIERALACVIEDSEKVFTSLLNTNNSFLLLSNTQFIENRTYQDDDSLQEEAQPTNNKPESTIEEILSSYNRAIYTGIELVNNTLEKYELSDSDSDSESPSRPLTVYKRIEPYASRRLPHIIGSEAFHNDDTLGLADSSENDTVVCSLASSESEHEKEKMKANSVQSIKGISSKVQDIDSDDSDLSIEQPAISNYSSNFSESLPASSAVFVGQDLDSTGNINRKDSFSYNGILSDSGEEGDIFFHSGSALGRGKNVSTPSSVKKTFIPILKEEIPPLPGLKLEEELKKDHRASHFKKEKDMSRNLMVVDSESDDEDSLFSSRVVQSSLANNKTTRESSSYRRAKPNRRSKKKAIFGSGSSSADESVSPVEREDKLTEPVGTNCEDSLFAGKKPVGGINIFSSAITKEIQSQKPNDSSNHSRCSPTEKIISSTHIGRRKLKDNLNTEQSKKICIPGSIATPPAKSKTPSSQSSSASNETRPKPVRHNSLFSDEEDLFSPIPAAKSQQASKQNPVSLFDDSDDDIFGVPSNNRKIVKSKTNTGTRSIKTEAAKDAQQPKGGLSPSSVKGKKVKNYDVKTKIEEAVSAAVKTQHVRKPPKNIFDSSSDEDFFSPPPLPVTDHAMQSDEFSALDKSGPDKKLSGAESFTRYDNASSPPLPQEKTKARISNDSLTAKKINNNVSDLASRSTKRLDKLTSDSSLCNEREESLDTKGRDTPNDNSKIVPSGAIGKSNQKIVDSIFSSDEDNIFNIPKPKINTEPNQPMNNDKLLVQQCQIFSSDEDNIFNIPKPKINTEPNQPMNNDKLLVQQCQMFSSDEDNIFNIPNSKINNEPNQSMNNDKLLVQQCQNITSSVRPKQVSNILDTRQEGESLTEDKIKVVKKSSQGIFDDDSDDDIFASVYSVKSKSLSRSKQQVESQQKGKALENNLLRNPGLIKGTDDKLQNLNSSDILHSQLKRPNSNHLDSQSNNSQSSSKQKISSFDSDDTDDDIFSPKTKEPVLGSITSMQNPSASTDCLPKNLTPEKSDPNCRKISYLDSDNNSDLNQHCEPINNSSFDNGLVSEKVEKLNAQKLLSKDEFSSTSVPSFPHKNEENLMQSELNHNNQLIINVSKHTINSDNDTRSVYPDIKHHKVLPAVVSPKPQSTKNESNTIANLAKLCLPETALPTNSLDSKAVSQITSNTNSTDGASPTCKSPKKPIGGVALAGGSELLVKLQQRREKGDISDLAPSTYEDDPTIKVPKEHQESKHNNSSNVEVTEKNTPIISSSHANSSTSKFQGFTEPKVISTEIGSSFEELPTSIQVLKSINKDRPRIQQRRNPPSRAKRKENNPTSLDGNEKIESREVPEVIHPMEVPDTGLSHEKQPLDLSNTKLHSDSSRGNNLKKKSTISDIFGNDTDDEDDLFAPNPKAKEILKPSTNVLDKATKHSSSTSPLSTIKQSPRNLADAHYQDNLSKQNKATTSTTHISKEIANHSLKSNYKDSEQKTNADSVSVVKSHSSSTKSFKARSSTESSSSGKPILPKSNLFDDDDDDDFLFGGSASIRPKVNVPEVEPPKLCSLTRPNRKKISLFSDEEDCEDLSENQKKSVERQTNKKESKLKSTLNSNLKKPSLFSDDESEDLFTASNTLPRLSAGNSLPRRTNDEQTKKGLDFKDPLMGDKF